MKDSLQYHWQLDPIEFLLLTLYNALIMTAEKLPTPGNLPIFGREKMIKERERLRHRQIGVGRLSEVVTLADVSLTVALALLQDVNMVAFGLKIPEVIHCLGQIFWAKNERAIAQINERLYT